MRKSTLTLAVSALMASGAALAEGPVVYGKINVDLVKESGDTDFWAVESRASRFGVKGDEVLNDSLTAFYKLEWQLDVADTSKADIDFVDEELDGLNVGSRNQYVGIKGGFGRLLMGRHDTPLKKAQGKVDLFGDLPGDIKNLMGGEFRADHALQYSLPKIADSLSLNAMLIPGEDPANDEGGIATAQSYSAVYKKDDLYAALAYDYNTNAKSGFIDDFSVERNNITRLVGSYSFDDVILNALYQTAESADNGSNKDETEDSYLVSASYKMGDTTLKAQYVASEIEGASVLDTQVSEGTSASVGADYKLSKLTKVYAYYTAEDKESENGATKDEENSLGLGLDVKF